jgi:hypothetical protein
MDKGHLAWTWLPKKEKPNLKTCFSTCWTHEDWLKAGLQSEKVMLVAPLTETRVTSMLKIHANIRSPLPIYFSPVAKTLNLYEYFYV